MAGLEKIVPLTVSGADREVVQEETRLGCMQAALVCLTKEVRIALVLAMQYEVSSKEGAYILDVTPELFRQRVSRGKKILQEFMQKNCALVNKDNECRCHNQAGGRLESGLIDMTLVKKNNAAKHRADALAHMEELEEIDRTIAMNRHYPEYRTPESFTHILKDLINSGKFNLLGG